MAKKTRPRRMNLNSPIKAQKFLSKIINEVYYNEMNTEKSGKLGYLLAILIKSFEITLIENRLAEIENQINMKG